MSGTGRRTGAVAVRVFAGLRADTRFVVVSTVVPVVIIYLLKVFWDALATPMVDQTRFALPGGAFIVHFVTFILTALVLVRERVVGTLERMFIDGFRPIEILIGYLGAYLLLATLQSGLILAELWLLFDLGLGVGGIFQVLVVIWLLAILSMALGMLVSNAARHEAQVVPFVPLVTVPSVFLSGMVVAVDALPTWAQALSRVVPLYYAVQSIHSISGGDGLAGDLVSFVMLPVLALAVMAVAALTLREGD